MFREEWKNFKRSWIHHTGMQLATLTVLCATFTIVGFFLNTSLNIQKVLTQWGDSVQIVVYLQEDIAESDFALVQGAFSQYSILSEPTYIAKEKATEIFRQQMASYAPDLLKDAEFANPFPASLQSTVKEGTETAGEIDTLERISANFLKMKGVEDVSYGSSWVKKYAGIIKIVRRIGWSLMGVLLLSSLFVIGNAIRSSISSRRDEIEILELVGATHWMIRRPYVFEGVVMGLVAASAAVLFNFLLHRAGVGILRSSLAFARVSDSVQFIQPTTIVLFVLGGAILGGVGAFLTARNLNDGWAASQKAAS